MPNRDTESLESVAKQFDFQHELNSLHNLFENTCYLSLGSTQLDSPRLIEAISGVSNVLGFSITQQNQLFVIIPDIIGYSSLSMTTSSDTFRYIQIPPLVANN